MTRLETREIRPIGLSVPATATAGGLAGRRWWIACGLVLALSLAATVPTVGDLGLTWDEPAYRFSQLRSAQWWERLAAARSLAEVRALLEPDALLFYWPYGRHGINFHPPLAGQLNVLTDAVFGRWMKDIPARRMASAIEYALTITIGFGFLSRRYGSWVGMVMAGSLLCTPRVYGDAHIAGTDAPGLLLWAATAVAFWKGLHEPGARGWRIMVGVLMGLAFVEKMGAVVVLGPLLLWLIVARLPRTFVRAGGRYDWLDGLLTSGAMLAPLVVAFVEILRLTRLLPVPSHTDLFVDRPASQVPGAILAVPLCVRVVRRLLGRVFPASRLWGVERPALETWTAVLAFAPVVGWLGNPAWWRETLPRLAHYYTLNTERRGSMSDILIMYLGRIYEFSLPWHNGWVLIGVTVPASILIASAFGFLYVLRNVREDRLPLYFLLHFLTLPVIRMLPTPAHDGVRLFLPSFFFLAAMAAWGSLWLADLLERLSDAWAARWPRALVAVLVLGPAAWQLVKIHPYELSYYNELVGGPRGAWRQSGFELSYWYDAFTPRAVAEISEKLPPGASLDYLNKNTETSAGVLLDLQSLGQLRPDIGFSARSAGQFPYVWLLTHDSKATTFTRLLYAMKPWYAIAPRQLDGLRVGTVADPVAVSRAWALWLLTQGPEIRPERPRAPDWVHRLAPFLGRFWGEGLTEAPRVGVYEPVFQWAKQDPDGLLAAARVLAEHHEPGDDSGARRLMALLERPDLKSASYHTRLVLRVRPEALVEAVRILIAHPDAVRKVVTRSLYTDPATIGGTLDRDR
jgi:hypothetical protein